jgi:hypothetical protein
VDAILRRGSSPARCRRAWLRSCLVEILVNRRASSFVRQRVRFCRHRPIASFD